MCARARMCLCVRQRIREMVTHVFARLHCTVIKHVKHSYYSNILYLTSSNLGADVSLLVVLSHGRAHGIHAQISVTRSDGPF